MPWFYLHYFSEDDATAIARYLKDLRPVHNRIPPPLHYGLVETIASKLTRPLPVATATVLTFADGDFGRTDSRVPQDWVQRTLIDLQWIVLIVGALVFTLAGSPEHRFPRSWRGWLTLGISLAALLLLGLAGWVFYAMPTLSFIPPDKIVSGATAGIPKPDPAGFKTLEQKALVERGRYLFVSGSRNSSMQGETSKRRYVGHEEHIDSSSIVGSHLGPGCALANFQIAGSQISAD